MINVELKPLIGKLNSYSKNALEAAAGLCISRTNYEVTLEHMLLKMLEDGDHDFAMILHHFGIDPGRVQKAIQRSVEREKTGNQGKPVFSTLMIEWIQEGWLLASVDFGLGQVRSGALVAASVLNPRRYGYGDYFDELANVNGDELRRRFAEIVGGSKEDAEAMLSAAAPGTVVGPGAPVGTTALDKFTINFTANARAGKIDPVFCRDREMRQAIDILGRRRKNNPIFVGEAGVGKTAVVEGLAMKVVEGDVPDILKGVEILGLDMGLLQAGASVKGEFENRLNAVITEVKSSPKPIILFIDEAHTLIGAGGTAGGSDAANLLKPALARGEMRTMAATTWSEYKKYFEKDPALARRFQLVKIEEPSPDDAVIIMRGLREKYEGSHKVYVRDDAIVASAQFAARYISGRQLPDKSVDLLDTSCARVKINISSKPDRIDDIDRQIKTIERELGAISRDIETGIRPDAGVTADLKQRIAKLTDERATLDARWKKEKELVDRVLDLRRQVGEALASKADVAALKKDLADAERKLADAQGKEPLIHFEVNPDAVSKVVADWTGIPVGNMVKDELQTIMNFAPNLKQRIKGQDHAIEAIDRRIRASKAGLGSPHAPIGVFLLVGPSGVGKTETGLGIADLLFGGERFVITINMSEYQEKHTVSRLIGSPPGYVGYGEGGQLTEAVRQRPYSVVLLDEVEKADPEVLNLFYQVFDKGTLTDGEGREIDFKNTVIMLTSNLATDVITELSAAEPRPDVDTVAEAARPILINHFKPALLARMEVIPFYTISKDAMGEIVRIKLNSLGKRIKQSQQMRFEYDDAVVNQIVQRCTEVETGARNIDYIINRTLLPQISTEILRALGEEKAASSLKVSIDGAGAFAYQFV
jgi:type VI secretion system protein VasG